MWEGRGGSVIVWCGLLCWSRGDALSLVWPIGSPPWVSCVVDWCNCIYVEVASVYTTFLYMRNSDATYSMRLCFSVRMSAPVCAHICVYICIYQCARPYAILLVITYCFLGRSWCIAFRVVLYVYMVLTNVMRDMLRFLPLWSGGLISFYMCISICYVQSLLIHY